MSKLSRYFPGVKSLPRTRHVVALTFVALLLSTSITRLRGGERTNDEVQRAAIAHELETRRQQWLAERSAKFRPVQLHAPFWRIGGGFDSTLMINNTQPRSIDVAPVVYLENGDQVSARTFLLESMQSLTVSLSELIKSSVGQGQIALTFVGEPMDLAAQVIISNPRLSLSFNHVFTSKQMFFSSRLEGVFYLPHPSTQADVALSNTSDNTVSVEWGLTVGAQHTQLQPVLLGPHQTEVVKLRDRAFNFPREGAQAVGISLKHSGQRGELLLHGMLTDHPGFSANMRIIDPASLKSSRQISPALKLQGELTPILVLNNSSDQDTDIALVGHYTLDKRPLQAELKTLKLAKRETQAIDLSSELGSLPPAATDIGLELAHPNLEGGIVADLLLVDRTGSEVFQVTPKDSVGEAAVGYSYPWRIDGNLNTVITIANPSRTEEIMFCLFLFYRRSALYL